MNLFDDSIQNTPITPPKLETYQLDDETTTYKKLPGLEGLASEMNNQSAKVADTDFNLEIPEVETEVSEKSPAERRQAQSTAEFVVKTTDDLISRALAAYAKTDVDKLRADPSDIKDISSHFSSYFGASNFDMPPWVMGAIATAFVLFDKFKMAGEIRRINLKLEAEQKKTADLEAEIKRLKLEKTEMELKEQVERLKGEVTP